MQKFVQRRSWTCIRCLQNLQARGHSTAAVNAFTPDPSYEAAHVAGSNKLQTDDTLLRDVFNSKAFWREFSARAKTNTGLIGNKHLTTPRGFYRFAETSLQKCKMLVDRTLAASTTEEYAAIPKDLDRLSDLLCRVIDLSDFVRSIHPDQHVAGAASASYSLMFQYMNELNTTTGLNKQLKKAWSMPEVRSRWSREEKIVAEILMKDFAKSGIDLPDAQREEFVSLSSDIANIGTEFVNRMDHSRSSVQISKSQLGGVDPRFVKSLSSWGKASIPVYSYEAKLIQGSAYDPAVRKELYTAERTASTATIGRLEDLLLRRAKLAKLTGYESYAQMTLTDKMSKSPEAVGDFLKALNANNKHRVQAELSQLLQIKKQDDPQASSVGAWDHSYLLNKMKQKSVGPRTSKSRILEGINNYFAVGHVIQGLSSLFESLYGVRLVPRETQIGEVWHPDVRRLDVYTESQEHIATMYCDLFSRPGKLPNPAHFTLLCSRQISEEEIREDQMMNEPINLGMPTYTSTDVKSGQAAYHQIPIIALVCDFPDTSVASTPTTLSPHSVTTLFHEMGHAIHSILGRTTMQGISGTRCATDFAELPSVLMEYFATNPSVLKLFARHWQTDAVIPDEVIQAMKREKDDRTGMTGGWDDENQILMAMLDQVYHTEGPLKALVSGGYDSTLAYHSVWDNNGSFIEPPDTAWQGFFGHLYGYGATYYSYLFDRAIAWRVWQHVFKDGVNGAAIDRQNGELMKEEVLKWGGGRDPWLCLEGLMGGGRGVLAEGGTKAMHLVGQWGSGAASESGI